MRATVSHFEREMCCINLRSIMPAEYGCSIWSILKDNALRGERVADAVGLGEVFGLARFKASVDLCFDFCIR